MFIKQLLATIVAIIALAQLSLQASTAYDPFYSAGVVEFRPSTSLTAEARMLDNLKDYLSILESEEAKNLDIIVFPESTLNNNEQATFVPNPSKDLIVPCEVNTGEYNTLLVQLSCAAKKLSAYVVINLTEKEWCTTVPEDTRPCASSGLNLYNTNVVLDRKGTVISRYRKVHLYGENKNSTFMPEMDWFDTDFGVRFGHFICFDILFYVPAQSLVNYSGIKDFIFPSMWFSQLPFLTAVQVHQAWSYANNVNLLAAGSSNPLVGSTGTGVYHGRQGIVVAKMNQGIGERKLYVAQVPKYRHLTKRSLDLNNTNKIRLSLPNIKLKRDYLQNYETVALNLTTSTSVKQEICFTNSSFCCNFELKWQPLTVQPASKYYQYRLGVYDGWRNEEAAETNQLKNCALFSCIGEDIMDCGKTMATDIDVVFENITIWGTYPKAERFLIMPNSLTADMMPLPVNHFQWQRLDTKNNLQMRYELNTTTPNVMAFSIYGNYYDCIVDLKPDEDEGGDDAAAALNNSFFVIVGIFLINLLVLFLGFTCKVRADNSYYTAGVVEFKPQVGGMNSSELLADHLKAYLSILESSEALDTDIIVFPEGTLNNQFHLTYVPNENDKIIPCVTNKDNLYADFFVQLSCAARRVSKYLVINLPEKENCPSSKEDSRPCASNNLNIYNTNVVFDREGRVVSRYRKVHVYVENKNTTSKPEFAIFETDFGVRFGHFICFDMLFYTPAQELVDRFGVTDLIFTSLFYSELPFLTAVQLQHGWAWGNNVNLLAAGASYPEWGMTGSGIYSGQLGDLVSVMVSDQGERKLYKARVPKKGSKLQPQPNTQPLIKPSRNITKLRLLKDPQIVNYNSVLLDFSRVDSFTNIHLCDGDVCCSFEINAQILNFTLGLNFKYRVGIFDGRRTYEKEEWSDIKVCALYACANTEPSSCGEALSADNVLFKSINIKGKFPNANKLMIMPSILDDQLYPLKHNEVVWSKTKQNQGYEVVLKLNKELSNIMTFGIYGQYYEKSSAAAIKAGNMLIFAFILLKLLGFMNYH
ncbi:uncharacterized protein LOC135958754 [Calliphora vicina]|uniref:uncharacterized protein LOC135958754 n=1 Tax=Calliphora vicina TaxID=7373 RepID=UPI00325A725D